jgi:hypothetical protein
MTLIANGVTDMLPRWRTDPSRRPTGALRIGLHVALPLLVSWSWASSCWSDYHGSSARRYRCS